ncbi:hypothetical protein EMCRGX_G018732 [Ephydatia muelleri]|eukprot:Em0012g1038a
MASADQDQLKAIFAQVDELFATGKSPEALPLLKPYSSRSDNAEVQWRLARLQYTIGKFFTKDQDVAKQLSVEALEAAKKAVAADERSCFAHKWMGIALSWSSDFEGSKMKIENAYIVRDHFLKAVECNPNDPTSYHLLGVWCYKVAEMPWLQRKLAEVVFTAPPSSSYDEALGHFVKAEQVQPGFYVSNWLYLGKTYSQLGKKTDAKEWLSKAASVKSEDPKDVEAMREAAAMLAKL